MSDYDSFNDLESGITSGYIGISSNGLQITGIVIRIRIIMGY